MFSTDLRLIIRRLAALLILLGVSWSSSALAQDVIAPEDKDQGVIQKINLGMNRMVVSGNVYDVSTEAKVEINGTYGAFTMLETGMRIEFTYKKFSDGVRQIIEVRELGDNEVMDEA